MKFTLIAAFVAVLALAQGSFAQDATGAEVLEQIEQFKTKATQMLEKIDINDLSNQAQTLRTQIEEQIRAAAANMESLPAQFDSMLQELRRSVENALKPPAAAAN